MDFEAATDVWLKELLASLRGEIPGVFVEVIEEAVCRHNGTTLLYQGELYGNKLNDVSSIRSDWWGAGRSAQTVRALCLSELAGAWEPENFLCVKADVE